jgi:hypothetical protein
MSQKTFSGVLLEMFDRDPYEFLGMFLIIMAGICLALIVTCYLFRRQTLRHAERSAMIQAGIHPDYPPDEVPETVPQESHEVY